MKKGLKLILVFMILTLISCENIDLTQDETNSTESKINPTNPVGIGYTDVKAWYINNGLTSSCTKNILVFPSWARYNQVIDYLDQQTETYCDAFDAQQPTPQTDDEYDNACLVANFDEDNKLLQFENNFTFCSLRKKINSLEDAWLELQGDGVWDANTDPDNHFIEDDTERAMLNEGVEVIIGLGTRENPYKIYKFNADGSYYIINNMNVTVLQQINNGIYVAGSSADVVKVIDPKPIPPVGCKNDIHDIQYVSNGSDRLKRKSKVVNGASLSRNKIFASTKGYRKKNGKWKNRRAWVAAAVTNIDATTNGLTYTNCSTEENAYGFKEKRRRKVKVKKTFNYGDTNTIGVHDNRVYSYHKKESLSVILDYYDLP